MSIEWTEERTFALRDFLLHEQSQLQSGKKLGNLNYKNIANRLNHKFPNLNASAQSVRYKKNSLSSVFRKIHEVSKINGVTFNPNTYHLQMTGECYQQIREDERSKASSKYFSAIKINSQYGNMLFKSLERIFQSQEELYFGKALETSNTSNSMRFGFPLNGVREQQDEPVSGYQDIALGSQNPQFTLQQYQLQAQAPLTSTSNQHRETPAASHRSQQQPIPQSISQPISQLQYQQHQPQQQVNIPQLKQQRERTEEIAREDEELADDEEDKYHNSSSATLQGEEISRAITPLSQHSLMKRKLLEDDANILKSLNELKLHVKRQKIESVVQKLQKGIASGSDGKDLDLLLSRLLLPSHEPNNPITQFNSRIQQLFDHKLITKSEMERYVTLTVENSDAERSIHEILKNKLVFEDLFLAVAFKKVLECAVTLDNR